MNPLPEQLQSDLQAQSDAKVALLSQRDSVASQQANVNDLTIKLAAANDALAKSTDAYKAQLEALKLELANAFAV